MAFRARESLRRCRSGLSGQDVERTFADLTRSKAELGYEPKISLAEGLKRFVAWFNEFGHLYKLPGEK